MTTELGAKEVRDMLLDVAARTAAYADVDPVEWRGIVTGYIVLFHMTIHQFDPAEFLMRVIALRHSQGLPVPTIVVLNDDGTPSEEMN